MPHIVLLLEGGGGGGGKFIVLTELIIQCSFICCCCVHVQEACRDVNIRMSLTKVFKSDELVVVIHVTNQNQSSLPSVALTITPPSVMKTQLVSESNMETVLDLPGFGTVRSGGCVGGAIDWAWLVVYSGMLFVAVETII